MTLIDCQIPDSFTLLSSKNICALTKGEEPTTKYPLYFKDIDFGDCPKITNEAYTK